MIILKLLNHYLINIGGLSAYTKKYYGAKTPSFDFSIGQAFRSRL